MKNHLFLLCKYSGESNPVRLYAHLCNETTNRKFGSSDVSHSLFAGMMAVFVCLWLPLIRHVTKGT